MGLFYSARALRDCLLLKISVNIFILGNMQAKAKHRTLKKTNRRPINPLQAALDYGIDISMLADNLKRTPAERIRRHQIALNTMEMLKAKKKLNRRKTK
jgi:hypothetical protein